MVRPSIHALAQRGTPSSSHSRVRWQPYNASNQSSQSRTSPCLPTPASSVSSISPSPHPISEDRLRHAYLIPRECQLRDAHKSKYALGLVDQTVKSLCEIWPPQDIPHIFLTSCRPAVATPSPLPTHMVANSQLYSPLSPSIYPSPVASPLSSCLSRVPQVLNTQSFRCDATSMRGFVQEVLRRSRTSGSVLQTALCYLEAVRAKVPEIVRHEQNSPETTKGPGSSERLTCIEDVFIAVDDTVFDGRDSSDDAALSDSLLATVRMDYEREVDSLCVTSHLGSDDVPPHKSQGNAKLLPPLPLLPSPLLCPRRTFLASLILASKFMQDRCYSNRAWAKLSGLSPREVGRCERALGEALEWRLWVGKLPAAQSNTGRSLTKSKSESDIINTPQLRRHATYSGFESYGEILPPPPASWTPASMVMHQTTGTPSVYAASPSTPGLSFSPTPTESSIGERTVQVSSFMDVLTPPPGQFAAFGGAQNGKASLVPNESCIYSTSQDAPLPPHPFEGLHLPNSGFPPQLPAHRTMYPSWSMLEYA
ncbi:hypothetical protein EDC04DRAFT_3103617 [Pisolithus marmoratus]|nr:hypothetical protein EDC04DRAFT_3103617 [Pisolithus marmoratus]